jgi:hypothetical protein
LASFFKPYFSLLPNFIDVRLSFDPLLKLPSSSQSYLVAERSSLDNSLLLALSTPLASQLFIPLFGIILMLTFLGQKGSIDCAPVSCIATNWIADEYAGFGSYSMFEVGLEEGDKDIEIMRDGLPGKVILLFKMPLKEKRLIYYQVVVFGSRVSTQDHSLLWVPPQAHIGAANPWVREFQRHMVC